MSKRVNEYELIKKLPSNAVNVEEYAAIKGIKKQAIYNQIRRGKADGYKIVIFKGFNFVIPNN